MWVCVLAAETFSPSTKREEVVGGSKAPSEEKKKKKEKNWRTSRWRPPRAPALLLLQQHSLTHTRLWLDRKIGGKNLHFWKVNRHPFYPHHHANLPVLPNAKDTKCKEQFEIYLEIHIFFKDLCIFSFSLNISQINPIPIKFLLGLLQCISKIYVPVELRLYFDDLDGNQLWIYRSVSLVMKELYACMAAYSSAEA